MCFQIERTSGLCFSAEYSSFSVGPETDKYRLSVAGYSGDAGDAIGAPALPVLINNGMMFSTPDQDNDLLPAKCFPGIDVGGWWFNKCGRAILNRDDNGIWDAFTASYIFDVQSSRMLVKLD